MKNKIPQLEDGYTRIANAILEKLATINLSSYQTRVLFIIFRKTYGYGKKEDWISVSQIVKATGIHKAHISRTKKQLIIRKIVTSNGNKIAFQKDGRLWCKLPKKVIVTNTGQKVTNSGEKLPVQADTKETIQKKLTKDSKLSPTSLFNKTITYLETIPKEDIDYFTSNFKISSWKLSAKAKDLVDYCRMHQKGYHDPKAFLNNAVRKDFGEKPSLIVGRKQGLSDLIPE